MDKVFRCEICDKFYKSQSSLCNHNKRYHGQNINILGQNIHKLGQNIHNLGQNINNSLSVQNENECKYCNKILSCYKSLHRHIQICKKRDDIINENKKLKYELEDLKDNVKKTTDKTTEELNLLKKQINDLINKNCKIHYKTLQKINNSGNTNNTNNGTINNTVNIVALGQENINDVLTKAEKIKILKEKGNALPYMIQYVHFNDKFPQFKNIAVTNNRDKYAHMYDADLKSFRLTNKDELIDILMDYRTCDIEESYSEYLDELDTTVKKKIDELLEHRGDSDSIREIIKLLLFNNRNNVDISIKQ